MNKSVNIILSIVLLCILIIGCSKEELDPDWYLLRNYSGEVSFSLNGEEQNDYFITAGITTDKTDTISIIMDYYQEYINIVCFGISVIPKKSGTYTINKQERISGNNFKSTYSFMLTKIDGDAAGDGYDVLESEENIIEIESINGSEVAGNFQVSFVRDTSRQKYFRDLADTIHITNGVFRTNID